MYRKWFKEGDDELIKERKVKDDAYTEIGKLNNKIIDLEAEKDKLQGDIDWLRIYLTAAKDQAQDTKATYDILSFKLQSHDYKGCKCQIKILPEVVKAQNKITKVWTVGKVRNEVQRL